MEKLIMASIIELANQEYKGNIKQLLKEYNTMYGVYRK